MKHDLNIGLTLCISSLRIYNPKTTEHRSLSVIGVAWSTSVSKYDDDDGHDIKQNQRKIAIQNLGCNSFFLFALKQFPNFLTH